MNCFKRFEKDVSATIQWPSSVKYRQCNHNRIINTAVKKGWSKKGGKKGGKRGWEKGRKFLLQVGQK